MNLRDWWESLGPDAQLAVDILARSKMSKELGALPPIKVALTERRAARVWRMMSALEADRIDEHNKMMREIQEQRQRGR